MQESTRAIATELIRKPVKEAVREALHEEATAVSSTEAEQYESGERHRQPESTMKGEKSSQRGRSKGTLIGALAAIVGIAYLARRRMSSTTGSAWSEPSPGAAAEDDAESGYVSEGEMQTTEASEDTNGTGTSPSTSTDQ